MNTRDYFLLPLLRQEAKSKKINNTASSLGGKGAIRCRVLKRKITSVTSCSERFHIIFTPFPFCLINIKREAFLGPSARPCCKTKAQTQARMKRHGGKWEGASQRRESAPGHSASERPRERPGEVARRHSTFVPLFFSLFPGPTINRQLSLNIAPMSQSQWDPVETERGGG